MATGAIFLLYDRNDLFLVMGLWGDRSTGTGVRGRERGDGSVGTGVWERERGDGSVGTGAWGWERGDGALGTASWECTFFIICFKQNITSYDSNDLF